MAQENIIHMNNGVRTAKHYDDIAKQSIREKQLDQLSIALIRERDGLKQSNKYLKIGFFVVFLFQIIELASLLYVL